LDEKLSEKKTSDGRGRLLRKAAVSSVSLQTLAHELKLIPAMPASGKTLAACFHALGSVVIATGRLTVRTLRAQPTRVILLDTFAASANLNHDGVSVVKVLAALRRISLPMDKSLHNEISIYEKERKEQPSMQPQELYNSF
jgi:hypothetical protein